MKGRTFDGWIEEVINFPPTYKYEFNSEKYASDEPKSARRTPAWYDVLLVMVLHFNLHISLIRFIVPHALSCERRLNLVYLSRCDRILSHGKGIRLASYKMAELNLSDHRPVSAIYIAEVEVLAQRKLQEANIH
jgi:hypothetical protein